MKISNLLFSLFLGTILLSCNQDKKENKQPNSTDSLLTTTGQVQDDRRENVNLSIPDTLKKSASYFFSNRQSKDVFLLTIEPGLVRDSKSSLQISTADGQVVYSQTFDTYYFIKWMYTEPLPTTGGQEASEESQEKSWKSITPKQYETYFKKRVDRFFEAIRFLDKTKLEELEEFGDGIKDKAFLNEYLEDTTIHLMDVNCFDCDEGAAVMGYSRKQNKVVTLFEHD